MRYNKQSGAAYVVHPMCFAIIDEISPIKSLKLKY